MMLGASIGEKDDVQLQESGGNVSMDTDGEKENYPPSKEVI